MSALQVGILALIAMLVNRLPRGRSLGFLVVSTLALFWLQPYQEPVNWMFWLPLWMLVLVALCWLITSTPEVRGWRENAGALAVLIGVPVLVTFNRYTQVEVLFPVDIPRPQVALVVLLVALTAGVVLVQAHHFFSGMLVLAMLGLVAMLAVLKTPSGWGMLFGAVAGWAGREAAGPSTITWLGFSYVAFRLLHTLLDKRAGRLTSVSLGEYVNYVIFFPTLTAGPIDRIERFTHDLRLPLALEASTWLMAGTRLFRGLVKKFVIADGLAWFALSDLLAGEVQSRVWLWFLLYAYSLRIYFDFSGYTDIAIGLGLLLGIRLPENFDAPYLKPNITQFWNAWHMTLTQWFRAYFFNPLTRALRSAQRPLPQWLMILLAQSATMLLIGLWHGVTWNFLAWGAWHALGLFVHNRWSDWAKTRTLSWNTTLANYLGVLLTFHYVTLGWLFFFLPDPATAWSALLRLLGAA